MNIQRPDEPHEAVAVQYYTSPSGKRYWAARCTQCGFICEGQGFRGPNAEALAADMAKAHNDTYGFDALRTRQLEETLAATQRSNNDLIDKLLRVLRIEAPTKANDAQMAALKKLSDQFYQGTSTVTYRRLDEPQPDYSSWREDLPA